MATIQPKGEKVRQAVKWISGNLRDDETQPLAALIREASNQFNLSPKEEAFLTAFYEQNPDGGKP